MLLAVFPYPYPMIGKLRGRVDETGDDWLILDVGGVGYHVFAPGRVLSRYQPGDSAELLIETHVREDHIHLFGFPDAAEREWFRVLTGVQGVGNKMALAVLGVFAPAELAQTIAAQDSRSITRVPGVGPKLAERLVTELKTKVAKLATGPVTIAATAAQPTRKAAPATGNTLQDDATSALANLGYGRSEAFAAVALAIQKNGAAKLDDAIRLALKELAG